MNRKIKAKESKRNNNENHFCLLTHTVMRNMRENI